MNRQKFQLLLESIKIPEGMSQKEMQEILKPVNTALLKMVPEQLYKYRTCTPNHIAAFENNKIWLSTSDLFNDPFDTLIQYNERKMTPNFDGIAQPEVFETMTRIFAAGGQLPAPLNQIVDAGEVQKIRVRAADAIKRHANIVPTKHQLSGLQLLFDLCMKVLPKIAQRFSKVACFSETIDSILMWSHYSCNHTGFALGYNLRSFLLPNEPNLGLFPVIYSNKRYNAEKFYMYLFGSLLGLPMHNPDAMSPIKLLLYKSLDWQYELEWRVINSKSESLLQGRSSPITLRPNSIYYGYKISTENLEKLHTIAEKKNIKEHWLTVDNASNEYKMIVKHST